jgi:uncharacterized protein YxjI
MPGDTTFQHDHFVFREKVFRFFGGKFDIYDSDRNLVLHSEQKSFKLREDMHLYSDKSRTIELLSIKTGQILDTGSTYEVTDSRSAQTIGFLRRKGLKSLMVRDEWLLSDSNKQEVALIQEDSKMLGVMRRLIRNLAYLVPQSYTVSAGGEPVAFFRQHFNPFVLKYDLDLSPDREKRLDRRLVITAGILLCAIEGRQ